MGRKRHNTVGSAASGAEKGNALGEDAPPWTFDEMRARYPKKGKPLNKRTAERALKLLPHFKQGRDLYFPRKEVLEWERERTVRVG